MFLAFADTLYCCKTPVGKWLDPIMLSNWATDKLKGGTQSCFTSKSYNHVAESTDKYKWLNRVWFWKWASIKTPSQWLLLRSKKVSIDTFPTLFEIVPLNIFPTRKICCRYDMFPIESGIEPQKELNSRFKVFNIMRVLPKSTAI